MTMNFLSWPQCSALCKQEKPSEVTALQFRWANQTDHVLRRFFATKALPNLQEIVIDDPIWGSGPKTLFKGLEARGRALNRLTFITYFDLARTKVASFTLTRSDEGLLKVHIQRLRGNVSKNELYYAINSFELDNAVICMNDIGQR